MTIRLQRIYDLAREFQDENQDDAWEELFDYLHRTGFRDCYSNENELFSHFSTYMRKYGMYRKTGLDDEKLREVLVSGRDTYLEFLCTYNDENLTISWINSYNLLSQLEVSTSPVMITKLLMGFGGKTPAYDQRFLNTITSNPTFLMHGINYLVEILKESQFEELKTHGDENAIPWERVLDMAFWQGSKYKEFLIEI